MITKTWGEFPTAEEVKAVGVWEQGGRWWMDLKGIDATIASLANVPYDFRTTCLNEFFEMVKKIVAVSEMDVNKLAEDDSSRYEPEAIKDNATGLASDMMQVGVGVEWV